MDETASSARVGAENHSVERSVVWARIGDLELEASIYLPAAPRGSTVLIDVHGGAWSSSDRRAGVLYDRALAVRGHTVVAIDFRQAPGHRHPAASCDVVNAVRWVRLRTDLFGNARPIGLIGSSSGGHLALLAGIRPDAAEHSGTPVVGIDGAVRTDAATSAAVDFVIALWPVSDPFFRYRYAKRARLDRLVSAHDAYYRNEAEMRSASVPRIVTAGEANALPDVLVVQPGEDANVPVEMTLDLVRAYQSRGGRIDYAYFPDQPHAFGHQPSRATDEMIGLMHDFVMRRVRTGAIDRR